MMMTIIIWIWSPKIVSVDETQWVSRTLLRHSSVLSLIQTEFIYVLPRYKYNLIYSIHTQLFIYFFTLISPGAWNNLGLWGRCYVPAPLNRAEQFQICYNIRSTALHWDSNNFATDECCDALFMATSEKLKIKIIVTLC